MSYLQRLSLFIMIDSIIVLSALFLSLLLVSRGLDGDIILFMTSSIALLFIHQIYAKLFKFYKKAWEYASVGELIIIFKVVTLSIVTVGIIQQLFLQEVFLRWLIVTWLLQMFFIGGSRFCWRIFRDQFLNRVANKKRTLIIGAGSAGTMVVRQLLKSNDSNLTPVAFLDDDHKKHRLDILGIPVLADTANIGEIVQKMKIEYIIIAIPSLGTKRLNLIFNQCAQTKVKTQILPLLEDLVTGKIAVSQFRDVQVEDLLGRESVHLDVMSISGYISEKVVLVTGAGGSIGSEICRQIFTFNPKTIVLVGHGENSIYTIEMELKGLVGHGDIEFFTEIADIQDEKKMMTIMQKYQPHVVYHAAAHKHVPLMERNPEEAVKNNIIGTRIVAEAASWIGVDTFVMISSDKAVNPTSVMGATKRLAEMIIQNMNGKSKTKFVAVRFGNVLGSRGSVIPLFKQQIENGGPVTVTDPNMTRYFMTIPEASRLVIQAGALAKGGEIFVLDMGDPVKIVDLAKNLIKLSGYSVEEIGIKYTGIRIGEKLYEELLYPNEIYKKQIYPNIYIGKTSEPYIDEINEFTSTFLNDDKEMLRKRLLQLANNRVVSKHRVTMSI